MSKRRRRQRQKQLRHDRPLGFGRKRMAVGAGVSLGAALGMTATAEATTFTVSTTSDGAGSGPAGSLRKALSDADNGNSTVDDIVFNSNVTGTITLTFGQLQTIDEPLYIHGPGANVLSISGNGASRILYLNTGGADATITGLTFSNGSSATSGGAIRNEGGTLNLLNSTVSGSTTNGDGGGLYTHNGATVIDNSTFTGNSAPVSGLGGGVRAYSGSLQMTDSTISYNTGGRGLSLRLTSPIVEGSTISGNTDGGITLKFAYPSLYNTIVANQGVNDLYAFDTETLNAQESLIEDASGAGVNQTGPNVLGQDPQLGALALHGGTTPTQLPATTSPVIDHAFDTGSDQRGLPRAFDVPTVANGPVSNGSDIGAVELQASDFATPASPAPAPPAPASPATKKKCKKKKHKRSASAAKKKCKKKR